MLFLLRERWEEAGCWLFQGALGGQKGRWHIGFLEDLGDSPWMVVLRALSSLPLT